MRLFLKNLLFTLAVPGTVGGWLPLAVVGDNPPAAIIWQVVSVPLFAVGVAIYAWCIWDFASFGRGTPAPIDAPSRLVVRGLYRYSRNPMYVAVLTVILAWSIRYQLPALLLYGAVVGLCFRSFVVFYEEPYLSRTFGAEYADYRARVPRWLLRR